MRSFITGLVVVLLSATVSTTVHAAGNVLLWAENPTQEQLWANFDTLLDGKFETFGGLEPFKFETKLLDKENSVFAVPGGENVGTVLVDYLAKSRDNVVEKAVFPEDLGVEPKCEDDQGNLTVDCEDMDSNDLGFMPTATIASL